MNLFDMLCSNLRDVDKERPDRDLVCSGFTRNQVKRMDMKHPVLLFYSKEDDKFYNQGFFTHQRRREIGKINNETALKKDALDVKYYVLLGKGEVQESDRVRSSMEGKR